MTILMFSTKSKDQYLMPIITDGLTEKFNGDSKIISFGSLDQMIMLKAAIIECIEVLKRPENYSLPNNTPQMKMMDLANLTQVLTIRDVSSIMNRMP